LTSSTVNCIKFSGCCLQGPICLPPLQQPPLSYHNLLCGGSPFSKQFKDNICQYNAALAFTFLGVKIDHSVTHAAGPYSFCINGELHHLSGSLLPEPGQPEVYAQMYIHNPLDVQLQLHHNNNRNLDHTILSNLQAINYDIYPYVTIYKQAFQIMRGKPPDEQQNVYVNLRADRGDPRQHNAPSDVNEIAAVMPGDGSEERSYHRDIVLHLNCWNMAIWHIARG
jgi:hypothetical protein